MNMPKTEVKIGEAYSYIPNLISLITSVDETGKPNIMTAAWTIQLSTEPPLYGILISPKRYTYELITKTKEFVINIPTKNIKEKVMACGNTSGRNVDKFKQTGLTPIPAKKVKAPWIKECIIHLECKLVDQHPCGDHTLLVGEIQTAYIDKEAFDIENLIFL
jgi:flavin reductase (DIM6/NTAB) family NADH-FMN oxidoreductase RutF